MFENKSIGIIGCGYYDGELKKSGVDAISPFKNTSPFWKVWLFVYFKLHQKWFRPFLYSKHWLDKYANNDYIILFDGGTMSDIAETCKRIESVVSKETKLIFYYWNLIDKGVNQYLSSSRRWQIWTFDKKDSEKYKIRFANTFFVPDLINTLESSAIKYDISFIGMDKGRTTLLKVIEDTLKRHHLNTNFYIVENGIYKKHKRIPYKSVLEIINTSRAILDIQKSVQQVGLTLRVIEAIFLKKKLVTNNPMIKEYSFYNSQNILCLNDDWKSKIELFLKEEYVPINDKIKNEYTFEVWLHRLLNEEEAQL